MKRHRSYRSRPIHFTAAVLMASVAAAAGCATPPKAAKHPAPAASPGTVLVVLSSADTLQLKDGGAYPTGFYFPELMTPLKMLIDAGFSIQVANPAGSLPLMDKHSDSPSYFGATEGATETAKAAAQQAYEEHRGLCTALGICGPSGSLRGTRPAQRLTDVLTALKAGKSKFAAVLVPGGHAPMQDLIVDPAYGELLRLVAGKTPLGLICHAPVSLIAAMPQPQRFIEAHLAGDEAALAKQRSQWPFAGQPVAVFTTEEETVAEGGQLGGKVRFYPDAILEAAGAKVQRAPAWQSNVTVDGLLVTGQNPATHNAFGEALLHLIRQSRH